MYWVVQDNLFNEEGFHSLIDTLEKMNIPHSVHKVVPFVRTLLPDVNPPGDVIIMGSYSLTWIAQEKGWWPGSFWNEMLDYEIQRVTWEKNLLNHGALVCRFDQVPPQEKPFFIRPTADSKDFCGTVMDWPSFKEWQDKVLALTPEDNPQLTGETKVMVCSKKKIYSETRCWIVNFEVVTASEYKRGTIVRYSDQVDQRIIDYATEMAWLWSPCGAYVMDIADTPDGLKIIEAGNINSAGFYKADIQKLVVALEEAFN